MIEQVSEWMADKAKFKTQFSGLTGQLGYRL